MQPCPAKGNPQPVGGRDRHTGDSVLLQFAPHETKRCSQDRGTRCELHVRPVEQEDDRPASAAPFAIFSRMMLGVGVFSSLDLWGFGGGSFLALKREARAFRT